MEKSSKRTASLSGFDPQRVAEAIALCTCSKLRRATRRATQIYDHHLAPAGLTITQYGLLAQICAADGLAMGVLAERMGMEASTLTRTLRPLEKDGIVRVAAGDGDRRVRAVWLTGKGREAFRRAVPKWRAAQAEIDALLGLETRTALNGLLDLSTARLAG
jgi:DNA-binding MarR family transcriptional regulator